MTGQDTGADSQISMKNVLKTFRYWPRMMKLLWKTNPLALVAIMLLTLFQGISPIIVLLFTQRLINGIVESWTAGFGVLLQTFIVFVIFQFFSEIVSLVQDYICKLFQSRLSIYVNRSIMEKVIKLSLHDFENPEVQDQLQRALEDGGQRPYQIFQQILSLISGVATLISVIGLLVTFKWWMAFLLLVMPITSFYSFLRIGQEEFVIHYRRIPLMRKSWYLTHLMTNDKNFKEVKLFHLGPYLVGQYNKLNESFYQEGRRMMKKRLNTSFIFQVINQIAYVAMMILVLRAAYEGEIQIGNVVSMIQAIVMTQTNSQSLISGLLSLCQHNLYLKQLFAFLDMPVQIKIPARRTDIPKIETVEFKDVTFRYPGREEYALLHVSFKVKRGETLAIVGRNGSGKTTLAKVLMQLYEDYEGEILINGESIRTFDLEVLRLHMGVVFQDFVQYEFDMRHNIGLGNISRMNQDEEIKEAAGKAGIDEIIDTLPKGIDTQLGRFFEEGFQLSGGQWQRVAIARAFMRGADLYVLDEPSSMLDPEAETRMFQKFRNLIEGRIGIFISHRYMAVRYADHILMMEHGSITEQGNHEELMEKNGTYAMLYRMQLDAYRKDHKEDS